MAEERCSAPLHMSSLLKGVECAVKSGGAGLGSITQSWQAFGEQAHKERKEICPYLHLLLHL